MTENSAVFKRDLKEASQRAQRTEDQVQENIHTEETAVEKACNKKYEVTACFENRQADDDRSCPAGWLIVWEQLQQIWW